MRHIHLIYKFQQYKAQKNSFKIHCIQKWYIDVKHLDSCFLTTLVQNRSSRYFWWNLTHTNPNVPSNLKILDLTNVNSEKLLLLTILHQVGQLTVSGYCNRMLDKANYDELRSSWPALDFANKFLSRHFN